MLSLLSCICSDFSCSLAPTATQHFNADALTLILLSGDEQKERPGYFTLIKWLIFKWHWRKLPVIASKAVVTLWNPLCLHRSSLLIQEKATGLKCCLHLGFSKQKMSVLCHRFCKIYWEAWKLRNYSKNFLKAHICENRRNTSLNSPNGGNSAQGGAMSIDYDAFATTQVSAQIVLGNKKEDGG